MPKYNITVQLGNLAGPEGNAFVILGRVQGALKHAGVGEDEVQEFREEATSGDFNNLLAVVRRWVTVKTKRS